MFLVEYVLQPGDKGYGDEPMISLGSAGRFVFMPNSDYDGRRIVEVMSYETQQKILAANPMGETYFAEPTDVVTTEDRKKIKAVVMDVLNELGITAEVQALKRKRKVNDNR